ncbi:hypothetical protein ZIOFF_009262 [Zingiber officinale]|uniref:Uncharacterized protein n=1 Tax=Zingiber officinale TaxID=94328 RepID=A0A8J5HMT1_ZINOF|nr:hypothetical protein ZIOFF_009262 [Zingiber officinale]
MGTALALQQGLLAACIVLPQDHGDGIQDGEGGRSNIDIQHLSLKTVTKIASPRAASAPQLLAYPPAPNCSLDGFSKVERLPEGSDAFLSPLEPTAADEQIAHGGEAMAGVIEYVMRGGGTTARGTSSVRRKLAAPVRRRLLPEKAKVFRLFGREKSVHHVLGGGQASSRGSPPDDGLMSESESPDSRGLALSESLLLFSGRFWGLNPASAFKSLKISINDDAARKVNRSDDSSSGQRGIRSLSEKGLGAGGDK